MTFFEPPSSTVSGLAPLTYAGLWSGGIADPSGRPSPFTPVTIFPLGDSVPAVIFQPPAIPPLAIAGAAVAANPAISDQNGNLELWMEPGQYVFYVEGIATQTISVSVDPTDVELALSGGGGGGGGSFPIGPAAGDLSGTYPNPIVTGTHLTNPLSTSEGGTGVADLTTLSLSIFAAPTQSVSWNNKAITNLAPGVASTDAATVGQLGTGGGGGGGSPTGTASGDLGGSYPSPTVAATHLLSPLPIAQGGTGATTASGAAASLGISSLYPLITGLDATGATDCTSAINTALASGGIWALAEGTYQVRGNLNFSVANTGLIGAGPATNLLLDATNWAGTHVFNMTASGCAVRDLNVTYSGTVVNVSGIEVTGAQFCSGSNIHFTGVTGYGIEVIGTSSVAPSGCMFREIRGTGTGGGVHVVGNATTSYEANVFFSNVFFTGCTVLDGLRVENAVEVFLNNVKMSVAQTNAIGNPYHIVGSNSQLVYVNNFDGFTEGASLSTPATQSACLIETGSRISFTNGALWNSLSGVQALDGSNVTFDGVDFYDNYQHGLDLRQSGTFRFVGGGCNNNGQSTTGSTAYYDLNWTGTGTTMCSSFAFRTPLGAAAGTVKGSIGLLGSGATYMVNVVNQDNNNVIQITSGSSVVYGVTAQGTVSAGAQVGGMVTSTLYFQSASVAPGVSSALSSPVSFPIPDTIYSSQPTLRTGFAQNFDTGSTSWVVSFPTNFAINAGDTVVISASCGNLTTFAVSGFGATWTTPVLTGGATPMLAMILGANCSAQVPAVGTSLTLTLAPAVSSAGRVQVAVFSNLTASPFLTKNTNRVAPTGSVSPFSFSNTVTDTFAIPAGSLIVAAAADVGTQTWNATVWSAGTGTPVFSPPGIGGTGTRPVAADYVLAPSALSSISATYSGTTLSSGAEVAAGVMVLAASGVAKFTSILPSGCDFNVTGSSGATISVQVNVTFSDNSVKNITPANLQQVGDGRFAPTLYQLRNFFSDNLSIKAVSFQASTSASSVGTASVAMDLYGANTY